MHCMTAPSSILKLLVEGLEKCILALDVDFDFRSLLLELVGFRYPFVFLFCDFPHDTETSYYFPSWIPRCVLTHWFGYILNFLNTKKSLDIEELRSNFVAIINQVSDFDWMNFSWFFDDLVPVCFWFLWWESRYKCKMSSKETTCSYWHGSTYRSRLLWSLACFVKNTFHGSYITRQDDPAYVTKNALLFYTIWKSIKSISNTTFIIQRK